MFVDYAQVRVNDITRQESELDTSRVEIHIMLTAPTVSENGTHRVSSVFYKPPNDQL